MLTRGVWARWAAACVAAGTAVGTARAEEAAVRELRTVLFSSAEIGRSAFSGAGFKRALGPSLDRDGFLALGTVALGRTPERLPDDSPATRIATGGSLLGGYQWMLGRTVLAAFAGVEIDHDQLDPSPDGKMAKVRWGVRLQGEAWSHPTESTLLTATLIAGSAREHLWGRVSAGYLVWEQVFVGPEVAHYRTSTYDEWRVGLHATGLRWRAYTFRVSTGVQWQSDRDRESFYAGLTLHYRR